MSYRKNIKLYKRQKLLLALLQVFDGCLSSLELQEYLFLYTILYQENKSYEFIPSKYGCFSYQSYADRRKLIDFGLIDSSDKWRLITSNDYINELDSIEQKRLTLFINRFKYLKNKELSRYIFKNYPYYGIKSQIISEILNKDELYLINKIRPRQQDPTFFTIGYEGITLENYLNSLIKNNISVLCDVRKNAISRKYGFSKDSLKQILKQSNIEYCHLPELGIVSESRKELNTQNDYDNLFDSYEKYIFTEKSEALDKLKFIMDNNKRIAITCFESVYIKCHRSRVAKLLASRPDWNYKIKHI